MRYLIKNSQRILKEEGFLALVKTASHYIYKILFYPYCLFKVRSKVLYNINKAINFVFSDYGSLIKPMQKRKEITELLKIVKKSKPKRMLEIGTANGGTLFLFARAIDKKAHIISLDLPKGEFGGGYSQWRVPLYKSFALPGQKIDLIRDNSHKQETFGKIKKILNGEKIDFLFIDGDHAYEGTKKDFEKYRTLVRKNGLIVFHDIAVSSDKNCTVSKLWNELKRKYKNQDIIYEKKAAWGGIGVLFNR